MWNFGDFFVISLKKFLNKQLCEEWVAMNWCLCDIIVMVQHDTEYINAVTNEDHRPDLKVTKVILSYIWTLQLF